jgi:hypothetical protein
MHPLADPLDHHLSVLHLLDKIAGRQSLAQPQTEQLCRPMDAPPKRRPEPSRITSSIGTPQELCPSPRSSHIVEMKPVGLRTYPFLRASA